MEEYTFKLTLDEVRKRAVLNANFSQDIAVIGLAILDTLRGIEAALDAIRDDMPKE